jgi:hypothetical protein
MKKYIFTIIAYLFLEGCSGLRPHKSILIAEKAPIRVILVDTHRDIDPELVKDLTNIVKSQKYHNKDFNEDTGVNIDVDFVRQNRHEVTRTIRQ